MEYSKLNDLDAVRVCLEIMRPHCAASAYRTGAEYIAADIERCGLSANGRAYISLRLESKAPEVVQCPIYGLQLANYCTSRSHDLRNLWEWLRAFYHAYGYAMQMAIADRDTAEAAANWLKNWHTRWESVQQPIADAAAILLERRDLTPAERTLTALVLGHCRHPHPAEDAPESLASLVDREAIAAALENLAKPQQRRAAAPALFRDIVNDAQVDPEKLLEWLHTQIDGKGGAFVAAHLIALDEIDVLKMRPTPAMFAAEFPECGKWGSIAAYLKPKKRPKKPNPDKIEIPAEIYKPSR